MSTPLLEIQNLSTAFATSRGVATAVDSVNLTTLQGETLGIVGESGCGKTVLALSIMGLVPDPPGQVVAGRVLFKGRDLLRMTEAELCQVRGNDMAMIFQEPMTSLNPVFRVGEQIAEAVRLHRHASRSKAMERAVEMLDMVGIPDPALRAKSYPHELSGGMRQRVMIAMALSCDPELLLADEPTTALDVTIQAQILDLLIELRERTGAAQMLITHDLGVVARMCHRAVVMYAGQVVEQGLVNELFKEPLHPYTQGLMASLPRPGAQEPLTPISGTVPSIFNLPQGCRFQPRCVRAFAKCCQAPPLLDLGSNRSARCWLHESAGAKT